jgi:hypothetical protein
VLAHGGAKEDSDSVMLLRMTSSDGSSSSSSSSSSQEKRLVHELPLPKGPDDKRPDVVRRTVRRLFSMMGVALIGTLAPTATTGTIH